METHLLRETLESFKKSGKAVFGQGFLPSFRRSSVKVIVKDVGAVGDDSFVVALADRSGKGAGEIVVPFSSIRYLVSEEMGDNFFFP